MRHNNSQALHFYRLYRFSSSKLPPPGCAGDYVSITSSSTSSGTSSSTSTSSSTIPSPPRQRECCSGSMGPVFVYVVGASEASPGHIHKDLPEAGY